MEERLPLRKLLSGNEAFCLLEIINMCLSCESRTNWLEIFNKIQDIIPFEYSVSGIAKINNSNTITIYNIINVNYPDEWLALYIEKDFKDVDVVVQEHFTKFDLQFWEYTHSKYRETKRSKEFWGIAQEFGLSRGITYGEVFQNGEKYGTLFSFAGDHVDFSNRTKAIILNIVPHLHQILIKANINNNGEKLQKRNVLTSREKEVLNWLKEGKSSWDISVILGISERTVNFHTYNIMQKLNAVNRLQAVAIALHLGLIYLE